MAAVKLDDLSFGDVVTVGTKLKTVLGRLSSDSVLTIEGEVIHYTILDGIYAVYLEPVFRTTLVDKVLVILDTYNMLGPGINDLQVGDVLTYLDNGIETIVVAVVDSVHFVAYDQDGNSLPLGDRNLAKLGWHINKTDFLTEKGREVLHQIYE